MSAPPVTAFIGIGSNLRRSENLRLGVGLLVERLGSLRLSPVYRCPAVGFEGPDFYNLAAAFDTALEPAELVEIFESVHTRAGRARGDERNVSRTLDIDLLLYGDRVSTDPPLPRDDVLDYTFVLKPLIDIEPDLEHPVTGRRLAAHWREMADSPDAAALERLDLDLRAAGPP